MSCVCIALFPTNFTRRHGCTFTFEALGFIGLQYFQCFDREINNVDCLSCCTFPLGSQSYLFLDPLCKCVSRVKSMRFKLLPCAACGSICTACNIYVVLSSSVSFISFQNNFTVGRITYYCWGSNKRVRELRNYSPKTLLFYL